MDHTDAADAPLPGHHGRPAAPTAAGVAPGPPQRLVPLDPRVRTAWWLEAVGMAVVVTAVACGAAVVFDFASPWLVALVVLPPAALAAAVVPALRYRHWRYALGDEELWLCFGIVRRTVSVVPLSRLQFVDTRQGPLDRALGLARLVVHTAALGTSGVLPGLDADEAARLRNRLAEAQRDAGV